MSINTMSSTLWLFCQRYGMCRDFSTGQIL